MEEVTIILLLFLAIPAQSNVIPNANTILRNQIQNIDQEQIIILPAIEANVEPNLEEEIEEINYRDNIESMEESPEMDVIVDNPSDVGESMHTAENIVFRPLFSYKRVQEKRKRLYGSNSNNRRTGSSQNNNRRSSIVTSSETPTSYVYSYPYAYPVPAYYYNNRVYYYPSYTQ